MKSSVTDILPPTVWRSLGKLGADLSVARRKRRLTVAMMCERLGVSGSTWQRMEKGDPTVSMGAYAQALFVLGFGEPLGNLADQRTDEAGLLFDAERLPRRIVPPRARKEGNHEAQD
ncbi:MAG: helix-turn-helix domain-containing protein [Roseovarius sp.]